MGGKCVNYDTLPAVVTESKTTLKGHQEEGYERSECIRSDSDALSGV